VAIAPDGNWHATTSNDNTVRIWSVAEQRPLTIARADGLLYSCAWEYGGREVAAAGERGVYLFAFLT
jgi:hypothetical protein